MYLYEGMACPMCGEPFLEDNDVVSCPDCGAPHHRACWFEKGACHYREQHGTGEQWKRPEKPEAQCTKTCPRCEAVNQEDAQKCAFCGYVWDEEEKASRRSDEPEGNPSVSPLFSAWKDPVDGVDEKEQFDGAPAGDVSRFVGRNSAYYIRRFWRIAKTKVNGGFNFAAFLFPGLWLLYRKMYWLGSIITGIIAVLQLASTYINYRFVLPLLEGLYDRSGFTLSNMYDSEAILRFYGEAMKMTTGEWLLFFLPALISLVCLGIGLYFGVMGNKLYYRHSIQKIKTIKRMSTDIDSYNIALNLQGGTNQQIVFSVVFCYIILSNAMGYFIVPPEII